VSRRFRTALIGLGRIGSTYAEDPLIAKRYRYASHAQALVDHPAFAWDAAVDPNSAALASAKERWGFKYGAHSMAKLLENYQPEIIVLATPPSAYTPTISECPELKAVLCEKPLGSSFSDAQKFVDLCAARDILVQVNFWRRCDVFYRQLAAGELSAMIGKAQMVNGCYGNGLFNNGSHLVDFCRMLFGEIVEVAALGSPVHRAGFPLDNDFDVACRLGFANGGMAVLQPLDFSHYREIGLDIWGERGRLELLNEGLTNRLSRRATHRALGAANEIVLDAPEALPSTVGAALLQVYDNLAAVLLGEGELLSPAASALHTTQVIEAIETAGKLGSLRPVAVPDISPRCHRPTSSSS
jgi:predicted dehydrogenase